MTPVLLSSQAMTNGDVLPSAMFDDDISKGFFSDVLNHIANLEVLPVSHAGLDQVFYTTSRDAYHGAREDLATDGRGGTGDEGALVAEARPSPMDLSKTKETVDLLCKFLQVTPLRMVPLYARIVFSF